MDASHDGFVLLARDGRVTYANAAAARVFGRAKGQALVGENWRDLFDVDSVMSTGALMLPELNKKRLLDRQDDRAAGRRRVYGCRSLGRAQR